MAETGRQRYWRQVRQIAAEENISIQAARRRWRARVTYATRLLVQAAGQVAGQMARPIRPVVRLVSRSAPTTCPLCRDDLVAPLHQCGCNAAYHLECAWEIPKCAVLGCGRYMPRMESAPSRSQPPPTTPIPTQPQPTPTPTPRVAALESWVDRIVELLNNSGGYWIGLTVLIAIFSILVVLISRIHGG